ncbi:hypothetical protein ABT404_02220 [Streptomyces hyaluromycini]|uniref:Uncharacterized protein n=1 Tax=Streptomyces hyaluromycini TaxID=1377993 RepID=A0ABV1WN73_9ACTN
MTVPQRHSWQPPAGEELVARAPVSFATGAAHCVLTDRRLLVLGGLWDPREPWEEVLWETDLSTVATVERRPFSVGGRDFGITFTDGSRCRLTSLEGEPLVRHLTAARP